MQAFIPRNLTSILQKDIEKNPAVVLLGPRQCGKTTLVKNLGESRDDFLYRDLERPRDLRQLDDPELFLDSNKGKFLVLDEIQYLQSLFPVLRGFIDRHDRRTSFLLLGSSSPDLLRGSAESLAGRVVYRELTPFLWKEVSHISGYQPQDLLRKHWLQGGYPLSFLTTSEIDSYEWRLSLLHTILSRDIPALGIQISSLTLNRFMRMISLQHGQLLNQTTLGNSLGVTGPTIRHYLEIFQNTFHIRLLPPWSSNLSKRLVKSPKVYIRDTGLLHALWETPHFNQLLAHPLFGASWEGYVIEQILSTFPRLRPSFYRTATGVEIDLVLELGQKRMVIETKATTAPELSRGFWTALDDLKPDLSVLVAPIQEGWFVKPNVQVSSLSDALLKVEDFFRIDQE